MFTSTLGLLLALFSLGLASAQVSPTSPDSTTVVKEGDDIMAMWNADTTGAWTDLEIQLMTGDNFNMVPLSILGSGLDGTTSTTFSAPAPAVEPNSAIYFLQFTRAGNVSTATWTTRFTIAAADGSTTPPTESGDFNGVTVAWGTGALVDASNSTTGAGAASASSSDASSMLESASASASDSSMTDSATSSAAAVAASATSMFLSMSTSRAGSSSRSASASSSASASTSRSAAAAASSSGAAGKLQVGAGVGAVLAAGWMALAL